MPHKILTKKSATKQNVDHVEGDKNEGNANEEADSIKETKFCETYEDTKEEAQKNKQTAKSIFSLLKKNLNN